MLLGQAGAGGVTSLAMNHAHPSLRPSSQTGHHPDGPVYAALDLGTNNCRMLVARPSACGFVVIDSFSRVTRLGEGLIRHGKLSPAAVRRTLDALSVCVAKMSRNGVTHARLVATEACRRAGNCERFADQVYDATGLELEIIAPEEEAALALAGCAPLLDPRIERALVFDIGGGSTELVWVSTGAGGARCIEAVCSLALGVVTLAEERGGELVVPDGYARVVLDILERLGPFEDRHAIGAHCREGAMQMLGTSGTVTTLGALHLGLDRYERARVDGIELSFAAIHAVSRRLGAMNASERARTPCIGPGRSDLVLAGCAILEAVCRLWPLGRLRVADRGVREGVLLSMMQGSRGS